MNSLSKDELSQLAEGKLREPQEIDIRAIVRERLERVVMSGSLLASDTGYMLRVNMTAEGVESADIQDASLTRAETQPSRMTPMTATAENLMKSTAPILIVEDTIELAEVIQATVESMGMKSEIATHGRVGLDRLKELNPKLLLLDIGLPDITGWELLKGVKEHYTQQNKPTPPIVVITAYGDPANRLVGKLQEIQGYLIKPFTPDQIEKMVTDALSGNTSTVRNG